MSDTTRVTMLWPQELKDRVRDEVGARGLTEFTVAAVQEKFEGFDRERALQADLARTQMLCQLLADLYAIGGEERADGLRRVKAEGGLPSWISTAGWPDELKALVEKDHVPPAAPTKPPEVGEKVEVVEVKQASEPAAPAEAPKVTEPEAEKPKPAPLPHDMGAADDLFAKLQGMAKLEGIDPGLIKPASQIDKPQGPTEQAAPLEVPAENPTPVARPADDASVEDWRAWAATLPTFQDLDASKMNKSMIRTALGIPHPVGEVALPDLEPTPEPTPVAPVAASDRCPKCGDELVAGECWTCGL